MVGVLANVDGDLEGRNLADSKGGRESSSDRGIGDLGNGTVQGWWGKGDRRSNYNYYRLQTMFGAR